MKRELICICCPRGCNLTAEIEDGKVVSVSGNSCKRGETYAVSEVTAPVRMVTTTIRTAEGVSVPVKTAQPIPKDKIFDCMEAIKAVTLHLPVKMGDVVLENAAGTGVSVIAGRTLP
jgi:CxxC motif-containing protein